MLMLPEVRITHYDFCSLTSSRIMTLGDALEFTAVDNPVFLLVNQTFLDQAPSRYTVQGVRMFIILDRSIKVVSLIFMIICSCIC